uniref:Uncharacterized protein n=1 Tax=Arundo donax TaxID=35708 RepID=A0A0A9FI13_ARUDO
MHMLLSSMNTYECNDMTTFTSHPSSGTYDAYQYGRNYRSATKLLMQMR